MAQTQPQPRNLAFHVTAKKNAESIFKHGILSPTSQGWNPETEGWAALRTRGFKFNYDFDPSYAEGILGSTFVRVGGVEGHRWANGWEDTEAQEAAIFAVCMDTLDALGITWGGDSFGLYWNGCNDLEVYGDIPPAAIVGRVSLGWMARNGYRTET